MIALYGTARIVNDMAREELKGHWFPQIVSAVAVIGLWILAFMINSTGVSL